MHEHEMFKRRSTRTIRCRKPKAQKRKKQEENNLFSIPVMDRTSNNGLKYQPER